MRPLSGMRAYLGWTRRRIEEMDAILASLEGCAGQLAGASKAKADELIAGLKKLRVEFELKARVQAGAGEPVVPASRKLEAQWNAFDRQVKAYFDAVGSELRQQQATFQAIAAAQARAWRETVRQLQAEAANAAAIRRAEIEAAIEQLKADAAAAQAPLQRLQQAGSWSALGSALADSRKALDRAARKAWDAVGRIRAKP